MSRRRLHPIGDGPLFARCAPVLAFFAERLGEVCLWLDEGLADHGVATEEGVTLGKSAHGTDREASVLAHELFHLWARAAVPAAEWRELSCLRPRFAPPAASIEELATDLLARGLCENASLPFLPSYPVAPPADLLERRLRAASVAVRAALLSPLDPERLSTAREALSRLCGHELASLRLLEADPARAAGGVRWPPQLLTALAPLHRDASLALGALAAPQLLRTLCRFLAARRWNDRRRGPLWDGDSPLELPGRLLLQRARAGDDGLRALVVPYLKAMAERLRFLSP